MTRSSVARTGLVAILAALVGAVAGYWVAQRNAHERFVQNRDLLTAVRAVDLDNRIAMLRLLRKGRASADEIESVEISAIVLLDTIPLGEVTDSYQSYSVLKHTGRTLRAYMHDFPRSQFEQQRFEAVPKLLAFAERQ